MSGNIFRQDITPEAVQMYHMNGYEVDGTTVIYRASQEECDFHEEVDSRLAAKHIGGALGLQLIPYDPIAYSDHQFVVTHRNPDPHASIALLETYGGKVLGKERLEELVLGFRDRPDLLAARRMDMDYGMNIGMLTNHSALHDVAVIQTAELIALGEDRLIPDSATLMSKLITRFNVTVEGIPMAATDVLSLTGHSFFSIPRTKSIFHSRVDKRVSDALNPYLRKALSDWLQTGSKRLAIAASGGIDEVKDNEIHMQRMSGGTASVLASLDRVLPVAVNMHAPAGEPWFKIGAYTDAVAKNPDAAHDLMEGIAVELTALTGLSAQYEKERVTVGERAHEVKEVTTRTISSWARQWQERRNRRWDDLNGGS